ncbi:MAG: hypothetical protein D6805_01580 [Planctomycetota bacterium]|nr:MAG: hypothetical protein D6805_01580 [Planctomycetota bacterium]
MEQFLQRVKIKYRFFSSPLSLGRRVGMGRPGRRKTSFSCINPTYNWFIRKKAVYITLSPTLGGEFN